jgi:hypothetical protein
LPYAFPPEQLLAGIPTALIDFAYKVTEGVVDVALHFKSQHESFAIPDGPTPVGSVAVQQQ